MLKTGVNAKRRFFTIRNISQLTCLWLEHATVGYHCLDTSGSEKTDLWLTPTRSHVLLSWYSSGLRYFHIIQLRRKLKHCNWIWSRACLSKTGYLHSTLLAGLQYNRTMTFFLYVLSFVHVRACICVLSLIPFAKWEIMKLSSLRGWVVAMVTRRGI